ncbi:MAG TPA: TetR/AcrR family transcriptional regulator [Parvularcula sp.]|nr:TetR/AcrR family transcriptional regulator [Parvularcula sp.]HBS32152.1 TetR/AcrR family transcriptional regulator [Parvularcula sp.]HBS36269.1 TetR/AcrR family transcriptional regulator [Parvularcula sp.]
MARTQAEDYGEKRAAIVAEAARLFAARGFDGASLADLAAACGMSKSLIYHYYPSKEAVLFAVMDGHMEALLDAIEIAPAGGPAPPLRRFARALLGLYAGAADRQKVLLYELARLPAAERRQIIAKERKLIAYVEDILARAAPRTETAELRARAMLFFGMLNWTHTWLKPGRGLSRDEVADLAARTVLAATP